MSTSRMIRLGADVTHFDDSVTRLIEDAVAKLPPNTVFEIRYGHSEDRQTNDLQWITDEKMQGESLWARRFHHTDLDPVMQADGKTPMPRVFRVARLKTVGPVDAPPQIEDVPPTAA